MWAVTANLFHSLQYFAPPLTKKTKLFFSASAFLKRRISNIPRKNLNFCTQLPCIIALVWGWFLSKKEQDCLYNLHHINCLDRVMKLKTRKSFLFPQ